MVVKQEPSEYSVSSEADEEATVRRVNEPDSVSGVCVGVGVYLSLWVLTDHFSSTRSQVMTRLRKSFPKVCAMQPPVFVCTTFNPIKDVEVAWTGSRKDTESQRTIQKHLIKGWEAYPELGYYEHGKLPMETQLVADDYNSDPEYHAPKLTPKKPLNDKVRKKLTADDMMSQEFWRNL